MIANVSVDDVILVPTHEGVYEMFYGYVRVSTETQAEKGYGLEAQENGIKAYASKNGITLSCIFRDVRNFLPDNRLILHQDGIAQQKDLLFHMKGLHIVSFSPRFVCAL